jgi:acyl carrier protein
MRRAIVEQHDLDPYAIVLIRQTSLPVTSSGKVQRNLCREQFLADELKIVHSWMNPAQRASQNASTNGPLSVKIHGEGVSSQSARSQRELNGKPSAMPVTNGAASNGAANFTRRGPVSPIEVDRAAERIEEWLLKWLMNRLSMDAADIARDRPFAEFGVDSLTAVELSQELEDEFKVPLPAIVAWNYPTPAALSRYLAEQSLGVAEATTPSASPTMTNGVSLPPAPNDAELAALLAEIENLSDDEAAKLLADESDK